MACGDCLKLNSEIQKNFSSIFNKAKELAKKENTYVFIFQEDTGELTYMVASEASKLGIQPMDVISPL